MKETKVRCLRQEDASEEEMVIYASMLRNPTDREEPGGLQPMASQRVGPTERLTLSPPRRCVCSCACLFLAPLCLLAPLFTLAALAL